MHAGHLPYLKLPCIPTDTVKIALKSLATRCHELDTESERLGQLIDAITATAAHTLRAVYGVGPGLRSYLACSSR